MIRAIGSPTPTASRICERCCEGLMRRWDSGMRGRTCAGSQTCAARVAYRRQFRGWAPQGRVSHLNLPYRPHNRFTPSLHKAAACFDSAGNPPTASSTIEGRNAAISPRVYTADPLGERGPRRDGCGTPSHLVRTSAATWSTHSTDRRRMSPQAGFDTSTVTAGGVSSPTLRGFWKCSRSRSGYMAVSLYRRRHTNCVRPLARLGPVTRRARTAGYQAHCFLH